MSGFASPHDVLPCPEGPEHDWLDRRMYNAKHERWKAECSQCGALLDNTWWGWEFKTGLEHFADAQHDPAVKALLAELQAYHRQGRDADAVEVAVDYLRGAEV